MNKISFCIPCYKSEQTIKKVVDEIELTMKESGDQYEYEIVLVNDCSPDNTYEVIEQIANENERVLGISLAKNFGQHAAIMAGLRNAVGDIVVYLDDDGQTPANEVFNLINEIEAGQDVVYAKYKKPIIANTVPVYVEIRRGVTLKAVNPFIHNVISLPIE